MTRTKAYKRKDKLLLPEKKQPRPKAVAPALAELPVSVEQCRKALTALLAHLKARPEGSKLIESEEWVELVVTTKKMNPRERHMPFQM
jgi:ribosome biogenesis protein UTP30